MQNISKCLSIFTLKCKQLINKDFQIVPSITSSFCPSSTSQNIEIANSVWWLQENIWKIVEESTETVLKNSLQVPLEEMYKLLCMIIEPLMSNLTKHIESIIIKIHKEEYTIDSNAPTNMNTEGGQCSVYVIELGSYLKWIRREIFPKLKCSESKEWIHSIATRILDYFLRHASIIKPINENGKLKLASDITQIEFILNQWFLDCGLKIENEITAKTQALKAFKPLLFKDLNLLTDPYQTTQIPMTILIHHIFTRAPDVLMLPHKRFGWTEQQYSDWIDHHSEEEVIQLLDKCLNAYAEEVVARGETVYCEEYPILRHLLTQQKK